MSRKTRGEDVLEEDVGTPKKPTRAETTDAETSKTPTREDETTMEGAIDAMTPPEVRSLR
jgi:hypothetical protein